MTNLIKYYVLRKMAAHRFNWMIPVLIMSVIFSSCQTLEKSKESDAAASIKITTEIKPIDWRNDISSEMFKKIEEGHWVSPKVAPPFAFDELIYSWNICLHENEAFRLYLKVDFGPGDQTPWLYAGFWGKVKDPVENREKPRFDRGLLDMDWLKLKTRAVSYQFKLVDSGIKSLHQIPSLHVITTDNHPTPELVERFRPVYPKEPVSVPVCDVPLRWQIDSHGTPLKSKCQSAALSSAMQYFGKAINLEDIVAYTHDPEYDYPGLWPRVCAAANEFGFDSYVDRFRDWNAVRVALAQKKMILCSIRMAEGDCKAPPYPDMGNHIVVLNGMTEDGRVFVTDSVGGLWEGKKGYQCQWLQEDFEKVWMKTKNGVAMVICPPAGFKGKVIENLPDFPSERNYSF